MPAPQIISFSDLALVEKNRIIYLLLSVDTLDTKETLQIQTDMSLQICSCGLLCLEKSSLVALAIFFRKKQKHPSNYFCGCFPEQSEMVCCTEVTGVLPPHFSGIELHAQNLALSSFYHLVYIGWGGGAEVSGQIPATVQYIIAVKFSLK